jgi:SagB-type dehydrogenase family enzyme
VPNGDGSGLRAYHDATRHSAASVSRGPHQLDWDVMPRPFKVYPELDPVPLPRDFATTGRAALAAIAGGGTPPDATDVPLDLQALAHLLFFSAGIVRKRTWAGGEIYFRAAACTGALYHIEVYAVTADLPGLPAGVWHFGPHDFAFRALRSGDHRGLLFAATGDEPSIAAAPVVLALTTTYWRNAWKYRARAYRHAFWDGGTLVANLLAVAAGTRVAARVLTGFADAAVEALLDVDPDHEAPIALVALGGGAPAPPAATTPARLGLATLPYSTREVTYPEIPAAHAAATLPDGAAVSAWRAKAAPRDPSAAAGTAGGEIALHPVSPNAVAAPVEAVVLHRGSARRFARAPIPEAALATILHASTRGIPMDVAVRIDPYVVVNAVEGVAPGAYAYDRAREVLAPIRAGELRRDAGMLALGQDLGADAAANVYWLADLEPAFARLGDRGYRAAALAAGIEGGKAYLASYAVGLGATGLTFFDDDVIAFFSPHARGKRVLFLVALGVPARANG